MHTQIDIKLTKDQFNKYTPNNDDAKQSNEGKTLMIFNDKSGSMSGMPWNAVQQSTLAFAESLWPNGVDKIFERIHLIYFESVCRGLLCEN